MNAPNLNTGGSDHDHSSAVVGAGCRVVLKSGQWLELDLSATQIKRLRRARKTIKTEHEGKLYVLRCERIKDIYPNEG